MEIDSFEKETNNNISLSELICFSGVVNRWEICIVP